MSPRGACANFLCIEHFLLFEIQQTLSEKVVGMLHLQEMAALPGLVKQLSVSPLS